ncbi:MAG: ABC transporter permease [Vicinamibacterales bacterium]
MGIGVLRRWRRHPRLAVHHLATIALGMAAVTAIVSLMLAMAFQPLPFREAARLVQVWDRVQSGAPVEALSGAELIEFEERTDTVFESFGGFLLQPFVLLEDGGGATTVQIARLEEGAFRALDLTPVLGPAVSDAASVPGGLGSVWISRNLWQSRFGGNPSVVGRTIRLAQDAAGTFETRSEVAGVLPADIRIPHPGGDAPIDVWAILPADLKSRASKARLFFALGRLLPARTVADAQAALTVIADGRPGVLERRNRPVVRSLEDVAYGPARRTIGVLMAGVGLVLLLALANLASLTVAEGQRRRVELAVRISLGASRARLWRDLAAEHVALTLCALGLGLPLAWVALRGLTRLATIADIGPALPQPPDLEPWILCRVRVRAGRRPRVGDAHRPDPRVQQRLGRAAVEFTGRHRSHGHRGSTTRRHAETRRAVGAGLSASR